MDKYTIYCNTEQTKKALKLGGPIINYPIQMAPYGVPKYERQLPSGKWIAYIIPTAEQMIKYMLNTGKGYSVELGFLIQTYGYEQGCLTFIDNYLK